eukprot:scaffold29513_cov51-Phaeocystis_antarctica.AAC.4
MAAGAAVGGAAGGAAGAETSALKVPTVLSFLRPMPATDPHPNPDCGDGALLRVADPRLTTTGCNSQANEEGYNVRNTTLLGEDQTLTCVTQLASFSLGVDSAALSSAATCTPSLHSTPSGQSRCSASRARGAGPTTRLSYGLRER